MCGVNKECVRPNLGTGYVGGLAGSEFIEGQLKCPLIKGVTYQFEVFLRPVIPCQTGTVMDMVGVLFTTNQMSVERRKYVEFPEDRKPQIVSEKGRMINDTLNWTKIEGQYTASGNESFVVIGFFPDDDRTVQFLKRVKNGLYWKTVKKVIRDAAVWGPCYYVYDDVSLVALDSLGNPDSTFCTGFQVPDNEKVEYQQ
jgi:hypothetical protein